MLSARFDDAAMSTREGAAGASAADADDSTTRVVIPFRWTVDERVTRGAAARRTHTVDSDPRSAHVLARIRSALRPRHLLCVDIAASSNLVQHRPSARSAPLRGLDDALHAVSLAQRPGSARCGESRSSCSQAAPSVSVQRIAGDQMNNYT